jgi:RNA polymerase sigma-70 factor, ECF subfamily
VATGVTPLGAAREREGGEPSDEELMARCRLGDDRAMDLLVSRYYPLLYRFAYRMLREREAAEDAAQEALLRAYRNVHRFHAGRRFSTWLLAITANLCRTELHRRSRRPESEGGGVEDREAAGTVESAALCRMENERIERALGALSPDHRLVVVLFYYEGMSQPEIAQVCGRAVGTVKSRLHYALARLRKLLSEPGEEEETGAKRREPC